jgi:hypothetical protein
LEEELLDRWLDVIEKPIPKDLLLKFYVSYIFNIGNKEFAIVSLLSTKGDLYFEIYQLIRRIIKRAIK